MPPVSRRGVVLVLVVAAILVAGVTGSVVAGTERERSVLAHEREEFASSASDLATALATILRRNTDLMISASAYVSASEEVTNTEFALWFERTGVTARYQGLGILGFVELVRHDDLAAYEARQTADPSQLEAAGPFEVVPPGPRDEYCLVRLGVKQDVRVPIEVPPGVDICALDPELAAGVHRAADEGRIAVLPIFTSAEALGESLSAEAREVSGSSFMLAAPVYEGSPATTAERRAALIGWMFAPFEGPALVDPIVDDRDDVGIVVRWDEVDPGFVVAERQAAGDGPMFVVEETIDADGRWTFRLTQPAGAAHASAAGERRAITLAGIALTVLAAGLLAALLGARNHALRLVEHKTDELRHQALHDSLTGLPNRLLVLDRAAQLLARCRRERHQPVAMFLDLDNFKTINDTLGHAAGDSLLRAVGDRIRSVVREADTVGRLGGDEFVVLSDADALAGTPELLAQRLLDVMAQPFHLDEAPGIPLTVGVSIGIVVGDRADAGELLRDADIALYRAKSAGRACFVRFDPEMQLAVHEELELEMDLHRAADAGQLFLVYQPTFALEDSTVIGVEALLRWRHPTRGVVPPLTFVPMAEQNGTIVRIGAWVLDEACRQGAEWHASGMPIAIAVNVSARQLETDDLVDVVRGALERSGLPAGALVLEITESCLMTDPQATAERLLRLKDLGVRIAVDDFGTGYSSLAYLQRFPVDTLKIDRAFVNRMTDSAESQALVHTLVQLGKTLGIETFAEGIEDDEQLRRLRSESCDSGQGFLFARPLEADAVTEFLASHPVRLPAPS